MSLIKKLAKLKWLLSRWQAMEHPYEELYRIRQFIQNNIADVYFKKHDYRFIIKENKYEIDVENLKVIIPSEDQLKKFQFYDVVIDNVFDIEDWRKDFKHNIASKLKPTSKIDNQNFEAVGDIRYVSTISRLHHLPFIMLAGVSGNFRNHEKLVFKQLKDWKSQNPYLKSVNWKSGIEAGIRVTNLIFLRNISKLNASEQNELNSLIDNIVEEHFWFLKAHLSLFSSANNHLLFELLGLFIISLHYNFSDSDKWRKRSFEWLLDELEKQTFEDGFSKEQSTHYHAEVMNIYLTAFSQARQFNIEIPDKAIIKLQKMGDALACFLQEGGHLLPIGDSDEGQILYPYFDSAFDLYNSLFFDIQMLGGLQKYTNSSVHWDLRNYLLWGNQIFINESKQRVERKENVTSVKHLADSGYFFCNVGEMKVIFDAGSIGYGHLAAHGHADALQVLVSVKGEDFLIDPGTYQYHSRFSKFRNYFRGTLAHNTISINGLDQAKSGGRMIWNTKPDVVLEAFEQSVGGFKIKASHNGFQKQGVNVMHSRSISHQNDHPHISIIDSLDAAIDYYIIYSLHFAPHIKVKHDNDKVYLIGKSCTLLLKNEIFRSAKFFIGDNIEMAGWFSPSFNNLQPTSTLRVSLKQLGNSVINTEISVVVE